MVFADASRSSHSPVPPPLPPPREPGVTRRSVSPAPPDPVTSEPEPPEPEPTFDYRELERVKTQLFPPNTGPYFTYNRVPWTLHIRKEVSVVPVRRFEACWTCFLQIRWRKIVW